MVINLKKLQEISDKNKVEDVRKLKIFSSYQAVFDDSNKYWTKSKDANMYFLRIQEQFCNDRLKLKRYLFLNEVYRMLDLPETIEGQVVGWIYNENNPIGDNFVNFEIFSGENYIVIDFNVDGLILYRFQDLTETL